MRGKSEVSHLFWLGSRSQTNLSLSSTGCVSLGKSLQHSGPRFHHLQNGNNNALLALGSMTVRGLLLAMAYILTPLVSSVVAREQLIKGVNKEPKAWCNTL